MRCTGNCRLCGRCIKDGASILQGVRLPQFELSPPGLDGEGGKKGKLGLAVDIGTTTVVAYLFDLHTGKLLSTRAQPNSQRIFGADVVSRLQYCIDRGHKEPSDALRAQIDAMCAAMAEEAGGGEIADIVVAGNTIMQHFFAGLDPSGMATVPFTPVSLFGGYRDGYYLCPCVSSYVGGDITAGLLAARAEGFADGHLLLDIGTNGEMAIQIGESLYVAATAAGPAFEGGEISCGAPASKGAVNHVFLENGELDYSRLGEASEDNGPAMGICGSGLVDLLACLLDMETVESSGYMEEGFKLCEGVLLTPEDVRKLQLAKAAIGGGLAVLRGLDGAKATTLHLAGGFASYMRLVSARRIGLIPEDLEIIPSGHAAGAGACLALLSREERRRLEALNASCKLVELSGNPIFADAYMNAMMFD